MQFGVCGDPALAAVAAGAGYDFAEGSVGALLKPREDEAAFKAALAATRTAGLPYPAVNCFVPADLKITGPEADLAVLAAYVAKTFARAAAAGVDTIVFGSGGARRIPDGYDRDRAWEQLAAFCRMLAPRALAHGVTVVVEPLNRRECNVLNGVAESARLVREVNHPALRLLVDAYHLMLDGDPYEDIEANADLLRHVHIATVPTRVCPGAEPCDFARFFAALRAGGYTGRVSTEAKVNAPADDLPRALDLMRRLAG